jgi:phosphate transport system substrate-binding protein
VSLTYRAGALAGLLAGVLALGACSSSGSNDDGGGSSSAPAGGGTSAASGVTCSTGTLSSEGSTAQQNAMDEWRKKYQEACSGATIDYNPTGSGAGVSQFLASKVDFAGSDSALNPDGDVDEVAGAQKACGSPAWDLPMVVGPIALAFKLDGVDKLVLDGPTAAKVFLGQITKWNDPAIVALNKDATLPDKAIQVFFRSDSSGTTKNFETYLQATAPEVWKTEPDKDSSKAGFAGQGKSGSQAVADAIGSSDGGIGYVEYSFAVNASLATASVDNGSGPVELSKDSASAAAQAATVTGTNGDLTLKIDYATKAAGAYPIILVTYEIVCSKYKDSAVGTFVKNFLTYTVSGGQDLLAGLGYAPLPDDLKTKVAESVGKIQ